MIDPRIPNVSDPAAQAPADGCHVAARQLAFDRLRGFVIALVVLHHSILAYCGFGFFDRRHYLRSTAPIVDARRWAGFDPLVILNDSFFMPLMFLLSGLFVLDSLRRKGAAAYSRDRAWRLGAPFALAAPTLMLLAYYPSFLMTGTHIAFVDFWTQSVFSGPWPAGPIWFVGVLFGLDFATALAFACFGGTARRKAALRAPAPAICYSLLATLSALAYLPLLAWFGPFQWFAFGPFAVQASRSALYPLYFFAGVMLGGERASPGILAPYGALARRWAAWAALAALLALPLLASKIAAARGGSGVSTWPEGLALSAFCAAMAFALLAMFLRFGTRPIKGWTGAAWTSLGANGFGIFVVHYPIVTWAQYGLLNAPIGAPAKAALVFCSALAVSWLGAGLLRRPPGSPF